MSQTERFFFNVFDFVSTFFPEMIGFLILVIFGILLYARQQKRRVLSLEKERRRLLAQQQEEQQRLLAEQKELGEKILAILRQACKQNQHGVVTARGLSMSDIGYNIAVECDGHFPKRYTMFELEIRTFRGEILIREGELPLARRVPIETKESEIAALCETIRSYDPVQVWT